MEYLSPPIFYLNSEGLFSILKILSSITVVKSSTLLLYLCTYLNIFCISYFIFKTNLQTLGTYLPSENGTLSLRVGKWDHTGSNEDVLEMLDDLILHGLSFELVRVISSIGKKNGLA